MPDQIELLDRLLRSVNRGIHTLARDVVHKHGLPHSSLAILRQVHHSPGTTVSEMARQTGLAKSHISKTVEGLAETGMLEKRSDPADQRLVRVYLTDRAMAHFREIHEAVRSKLSDVLTTLSASQLRAVLEGLRVLELALGQEPINEAEGDR